MIFYLIYLRSKLAHLRRPWFFFGKPIKRRALQVWKLTVRNTMQKCWTGHARGKSQNSLLRTPLERNPTGETQPVNRDWGVKTSSQGRSKRSGRFTGRGSDWRARSKSYRHLDCGSGCLWRALLCLGDYLFYFVFVRFTFFRGNKNTLKVARNNFI